MPRAGSPTLPFTHWFARHPLPWVLLLGLIIFSIGIGWRAPWPADEPRFALIAQEMLDTGQWLIPHRAGELYPDKPPIFMWAIALGLWLTGSLKVAFLLPSLLGGLGALAMVTDLAKRMYGPRIAGLTGLGLLLTVQFTLQAKTAQIDMLVTFFITLGLYGALRHALLGPARGWWYVACVAMGLGIITKGVGFLPLLLLPAWFLPRLVKRIARPGHWQVCPLAWRDLGGGLATLVATIALWGLPMIVYTALSHDPSFDAYRNNILFKQTGQRYTDSWHHLEPFYYYILEVLPWAWLPLSLALPWAVPNWWRRIKRSDPRLVMPLSFVVLMVVFFSFSPGKRGVYMLPGTAMFVLAMAPLLPGLLKRVWFNRLAWGLAVLLGALLAIAGVLGAFGLPALARLAEEHGFAPWAWWLTIGVLTAAMAYWLPPRRGLWMLGTWLTMFWLLWSSWGYALMDDSRSMRALMTDIHAQTGDAPLALPNFSEAMVLQARQPVVHFGDDTPAEAQMRRMFAWLIKAPTQRWALLSEGQLKKYPCITTDQTHALSFKDRVNWYLLPGTAATQCAGDPAAAPLYRAPTTWQNDRNLP
ncbi:ArnT family glycosyltransferase [Phytohalomonas tamaricis]|uniref:ArnT family glycosyltransferase n=1 Tax=Phytohalomonas tamaricis TaxID=2081032 RepID=UPI000D0B3985|nr:glycosyltransferase family 39 protein [Phytohalomonas tamaricis]